MKKHKKVISFLIILIMAVSVMGFISSGMRMQYEKEVKTAFDLYSEESSNVLSENEIINLPEPVKKYLKYVGAIGKPKVWNFRVEMGGKMRNDDKSAWMNIDSVQYNFIKNTLRMFYIKGSMFGIPAYGLHSYKNQEGIMLVKVMGIFPVVDQKGREMDISDTVTILNDMCIFAPATLIDKRIKWDSIDDRTAKATFTNGNTSVAANLYFDESGKLINFISEDRYRFYDKAKWSTPIHTYKKFGELNLPAKAYAIWHLNDREFSYAEFEVKKVEVNVKKFK